MQREPGRNSKGWHPKRVAQYLCAHVEFSGGFENPCKPENSGFQFVMQKGMAWLTVAVVIGLAICAFSCSKPANPESRFKSLFADLSVGIPQYQKFYNFSQPPDALKGDVCTADFTQSETQFLLFARNLGVSPENILSSTDDWIKADSKMDPKYPWMLKVKAHISNTATNLYEVHIEGMQPYD